LLFITVNHPAVLSEIDQELLDFQAAFTGIGIYAS